MNTLNRMFALSLAVMMAAGLSGCTMFRQQEVTEQPVTPEERLTGMEDRETVGTEMDESQRMMEERPVATQRPQVTAEQKAMMQQQLTQLQALKPGQPVSYYRQQYEKMGYKVEDMGTQEGRHNWNVTKNNQTYRVVLVQPAGKNMVQALQTRPLSAMASGSAQAMTTQELMQKLRTLEPGKKPSDYISNVENLGKVTEYRLMGNDKATILMRSGTSVYRVNMDVSPQNETVTKINVQSEQAGASS